MAMNQKSLNNLHDKKSDLGENIIIKLLEVKGIKYTKYNRKYHKVDFVCCGEDGRKFFLEVKTKELTIKYHDTGFNESSFKNYIELEKKYNIPLFIVWVDYKQKLVYGNWLKKLIEPFITNDNMPILVKKYPRRYNGIIYFHRSQMKGIARINGESVKLKRFTFINPKYVGKQQGVHN